MKIVQAGAATGQRTGDRPAIAQGLMALLQALCNGVFEGGMAVWAFLVAGGQAGLASMATVQQHHVAVIAGSKAL